jgi:hypothetical protein
MKNFRLLYTVLFLLLGYGLQAQITVKGTVKSATEGEPLIGATVLVKGTSTGASTDIDGSFSITVPNNNSVLQISYTGFNTLDVPVGSQTNLDIKLEGAAALLDEFVTVAYGTVKKEALTGSVGTIKAEEIGKRPINNITTAIEGAVPGVITWGVKNSEKTSPHF